MDKDSDQELYETLKSEPVVFTESQTETHVDMIDEGWHTATFTGWDVIKDVPVPERYQTETRKVQDKVVLWFVTTEGAKVRRTVNYTWGPRSNAKKLIAGMLGKDVNDRFTLSLEDILGTKCEILITHNPVEDYVYVNLEKARPIKAKK